MTQEWITDRKPTTLDSKGHRVWVMDFGAVLMTDIDSVTEGQPWMPITPPEPYLKPKRYKPKSIYELCGDSELRDSGYCVYDEFRDEYICYVPTREAAERIAAIYEEVMP